MNPCSFVALQLPEALLGDAADLCWELEGRTEALLEARRRGPLEAGPAAGTTVGAGGAKAEAGAGAGAGAGSPLFFVLGDTAYGEASVDEVAPKP